MKNFVKLLPVLFPVIFCLNLGYAQTGLTIEVTNYKCQTEAATFNVEFTFTS